MRNPWRTLLLRTYSRSNVRIATNHSHFQVNHSPYQNTYRSFSSFHSHNHNHSLLNTTFRSILNSRTFSTTEVDGDKKIIDVVDPVVVLVTDIFSKGSDGADGFKKDLELNNVDVTHDLILKVLGGLESSPLVARRFFDWVLKEESGRLSSKSFNLMLASYGLDGFVDEFWNLVETMKKKGYGVSKGVYVKVLENFEKSGWEGDAEKLRGVYAEKSVEKFSARVCKIIKNAVWGDEVEARIRELDVTFSNDFVKMVLENLESDPMKAFIFFRWVEESGLFKHDAMTYNAILEVLGREDCIDRFWKVSHEMRGAGFEMETDTYVNFLRQFLKNNMIKDAVDLYEFAMIGANKPSVQDCTHLLKKIVVNKECDLDLFSRVVKICTTGGHVLTNSMLEAVLKSLTSVDRFGECDKILKVMEEGGLAAEPGSQNKIAFGLGRAGKEDEANQFMDNTEAPKAKLWESLIDGYCVSGNLDKASDYFKTMVQKEGVSNAANALELVVNAFCSKNRATDAQKLLSEMVSQKELKPWHTTYKTLIIGLMGQGGFKEALSLLGLMKTNGYPPYLNPFIKYISKTGTADDSILLLKAMTVKKFPSTVVFHRVFEAFFDAKRHSEAQDFLSKCPAYIRNDADVLNLFCTMKSKETAATTATAVAA